ncbi:hypothetical protein [Rhizobium leguminosarum]|uniref:hypothetical protein n=1 Tax=Rhizobium leguminosarum TaxID=384 RepID=UPI001AE5F3BA|nr:hypothetical protein [Rhizobium leguminosarum]MBP2449735.1 hypothetical protein [Rhizobium leguminosarum]
MRYHCWVLIAICATAFSVLRIVSPVQASEGDMRATVDKPARVTISGATARASVSGGARVVVTIEAYEPSKTGPVAAVVSLLCSDKLQEIGRFGIFPSEAFSVSRGGKPQRFGFLLPDEPACRQPQSIEISLEPQTGNGVGASITIGSASIE